MYVGIDLFFFLVFKEKLLCFTTCKDEIVKKVIILDQTQITSNTKHQHP